MRSRPRSPSNSPTRTLASATMIIFGADRVRLLGRPERSLVVRTRPARGALTSHTLKQCAAAYRISSWCCLVPTFDCSESMPGLPTWPTGWDQIRPAGH
jgi:hypothetical protein